MNFFHRFFSRAEQSPIAEWWWTVDKGLLIAIFILAIFGMALVATASPPVAVRIGLDHYAFTIRHIFMILPALGIMIFVSLLSPQTIRRVGSILLLLMIFLMALIPFVGMDIKGAQRWIHLPFMSLQPSELMKPAFAIVAAWLISEQKKEKSFHFYLICAGLFFLLVFLLMIQPDFGMTVVLFSIFIAMILIAGLPFRYLFFLGAAALFGLVFVYLTFGHVQSRIDRFLNPESGDTYQVNKSLEAFANGQFIGQGPGQGTIKNQIPDAHADFIFAVAGEELGFIFTLVIVGLYVFIVVRGFSRVMDSEDLFSILACGGILTMIALQAIVHMGSSLHLLPTKGMTLPFISYGGSSTLAIGFAFGVLLGLTRKKGKGSIAKSGMRIVKGRR